MRNARAVCLVMLGLAAGARALAAQTADDEWIARCERNGDRDRERLCEVRVERLPATASLSIDGGGNGGASVIGWDGAGIEVHARIAAQAPRLDAARALAERVTIRTSDGRIRADGPDTDDREHWWVNFVVYVPRSIDLDLRADNGPVSARDVEGRIVMETTNGPVNLRNVAGDVRAETTNGPLNVELTGSAWSGRGLTATTRNGPVNLEIPEGYGAELETGTVNGPMRVDFPLQITVQGRIGRTLRTTLGDGGPPVVATTRNGPVTIRRPG